MSTRPSSGERHRASRLAEREVQGHQIQAASSPRWRAQGPHSRRIGQNYQQSLLKRLDPLVSRPCHQPAPPWVVPNQFMFPHHFYVTRRIVRLNSFPIRIKAGNCGTSLTKNSIQRPDLPPKCQFLSWKPRTDCPGNGSPSLSPSRKFSNISDDIDHADLLIECHEILVL